MDNRAAALIGSNVGEINKISSVPCRENFATIKSPLLCLNTVKQYNKSIGGSGPSDQLLIGLTEDLNVVSNYVFSLL